LRRLQQESGLSRGELARRINYGRSQLYVILNGQVRRPPEWDRLVEPLVRACTGDDERVVASWRRRHGVLVQVCQELQRQQGRDGPSAAVSLRAPPAQLPADVSVFTGRVEELAELDCLLAASRSAPSGDSTAVVISAVSGTAGVGKTALALRWAHRVRGEFPDGQLYVNLRGYDPGPPMSAGDALAGFLRALGLGGQDIPLEVDERAGAYRSLLAGRRMLVVLDNAADGGQVRPLLPGTSSCVVVVTSRDAMAGLVARDGARRLDLDLLPLGDAVALLRTLIGERVVAEPAAAVTLAGQCARLPLALRVAAELAASRPGAGLAELVAELADEQRRLDLFDAGGDSHTAVRPVFSWSYRHLSTPAARAFRLLGLHPGPDLDSYAAAALCATSRDQIQPLLDLLARAHLLAPMGHGRYGMHDLLRAYATHLAIAEDSEQEREAALTRLFDHYLATAAAAMDTLHPAEKHRRPRISLPTTPIPPVTEPTTARAWLDAERATLTAACGYTSAHGWSSHTTRLADTLFRYLETGGHYPDALTIHTHARHAAHHTRDRAAEAHALTNLGVIHLRQDRYQQAIDHLQQALTLARTTGDRNSEARALTNLGLTFELLGDYEQAGDQHRQALALVREISDRAAEARTLSNLGIIDQRQGRYQQAGDQHRQALALAREISDRAAEAHTLSNLGAVERCQGHYGQATDHLQRALTLFGELGDRTGQAYTLDDLGVVDQRQGDYQQAAERHQRALTLFRELGDRSGEAYALDHLGVVDQRLGHYQQAGERFRSALALFGELGDRGGEARTRNDVGENYYATGQLAEARCAHTAALGMAAQIGDRYEQARAHDGLGSAHHAGGDREQARRHWREALTLYTGLSVPEAEDVRAQLAALEPAQDGDRPE
jgi:tetratricopeptide (TPR) repeat protein